MTSSQSSRASSPLSDEQIEKRRALLKGLVGIHNNKRFKLGWFEQSIIQEACEALSLASTPIQEVAGGDARDAARYRWLRAQDWTLGGPVVTNVKNVRVGSDCPTHDRLDEFIDAARQEVRHE